MKSNRSITVVDNKTKKSVDINVQYDDENNSSVPGIVPATAFSKLSLRMYDPGYFNTAVVKSKITFIDGAKGILRYRGYAIEDLCENCSFLDVAHLLINGALPSADKSVEWRQNIMRHSFVHSNMMQMLRSFNYDAHPMGQLVSSIAGLSTFYPDANPALGGRDMYKNKSHCMTQILRIMGKMPTLAACAYRNSIGRPYNAPDSSGKLTYAENFMMMLDRVEENQYAANPRLAKTLEVLFILHADHELNCSTAAVRHLASSGVDPYTAIAGGVGALYGPLHGGANEAVVRMLEKIGRVENIPEYIAKVKSREEKLMGFGHRVYKNYDPRAKIIKKYAHEVFEIVGKDPLMEVALELERQALSDEFFIKRKLFPNVDFYSGLIYKAMGFPVEMFPVLFAIPRTAGWLAHWFESLSDPETRIVRPRQVYVGSDLKKFDGVKSNDTKPALKAEPNIRVLRMHAKL